MGLVPTLVHDGKAIFESNVINEYIEAQFPNPPLVPSDAVSAGADAHVVCL